MKLNLGCGRDIRDGYENVDAFVNDNRIIDVDLSKFPWPWVDSSADEILMLDFLEHFPYTKTNTILAEVFRILKPDAPVEIQVPSFEECSKAMNRTAGMLCNSCGYEFPDKMSCLHTCFKCGSHPNEIAEAGMKRLFGGQDFEGNFHYTTFTEDSLKRVLVDAGFNRFESLEVEHQRLNWNYKIRARKIGLTNDLWGSEP